MIDEKVQIHGVPRPVLRNRRPIGQYGARTTGVLSFEEVSMVLEGLELEASMSRKEKRAVMLREMGLDPNDPANHGWAIKRRTYGMMGNWRLLLMIALPLYSAFRRCDIRMLRWDQLMMYQGGQVIIRETFFSREKKTGKGRTIPICNELAFYIQRAYVEIAPPKLEQYIFQPLRAAHAQLLPYKTKKQRPPRPGEDPIYGRPVSTVAINDAIKMAFARFGVYDKDGFAGPHVLRKTYAIHMYHNMGADHMALMMVNKLLNHSKLETTIRYLGIDIEATRKVHDQLTFRTKRDGAIVRPFSVRV